MYTMHFDHSHKTAVPTELRQGNNAEGANRNCFKNPFTALNIHDVILHIIRCNLNTI